MQDALASLAAVFADPGADGAAGRLDELRARWRDFDEAERAALTPLAQLAAARARAAARPDASGDAGLGPQGAGPAGGGPAGDGVAVTGGATAGDSPAMPPAAPGPIEPAARGPIEADPAALLGLFGLTSFRPGQQEAVQAALDGRDALVVMPTGGGKSLCYQLPALAGDDLTVVVSPLIALMRDQCARLTDLGHPAVMLASGADNDTALAAIRSGEAKVVFAAPERFASARFRSALAARPLALFVVDEAHCVSEWGHDFRPDYLRLAQVIAELGRPPVMACTATATPKVAEEIVGRLGLRDPERVRSGFDRPNLSFDVLRFDGEGSLARKRATLLAGVSQPEHRPAVVYCGTRKSTEEIAALLGDAGLDAVAYHAGMPAATRTARQDAFMRGEADVVVATNAFGMGVDKADVRSVWHWALPSSLEAYYQEAGRAGRDGLPGKAVLLASRSDLGRLVRFIQEAAVSVEQVGALVGRLRAAAARMTDGAGGDGSWHDGGASGDGGWHDGGASGDGGWHDGGAGGVGGWHDGGAEPGAGAGALAELELDVGDDRDRIALAVAERAGALELAPGSGGQVRVRLGERELDHAAASRLCRAATDRRWQAYRSIEAYSGEAETCRRRQLLDHFGDDEPTAPLGRCCDVCDPPDWVPAIDPRAGRKRRVAPEEDGVGGRAISDAELEPLKAWRRERADGKPAYTVATDATLREVVRRRPGSADELLQIKGIGPSFVDKHADSLLELLTG